MAKPLKPASVKDVPLCIQISTCSIYSEVSTGTTASIFALGNYLKSKGIRYTIDFRNEFDLSHNFDKLANAVLKNRSVTHLFLVDPDLDFRPEIVTQMLDCKDALVTVQTPERDLDLRRLHTEIKEAGSAAQSIAAQEPTLTEADFGDAHPKLSFALIHRSVFDRMVERAVAPKFLDVEGYDENDRFKPPPEVIYGFFSPIYDDRTRDQLQSHSAFCYRWRERCNGKIRFFESDAITRRGLFPFITRFSDLYID